MNAKERRKAKRHTRIGVERGFGPRHAFNAQEGAEAVPSALPSVPQAPPDLGDRLRRALIDQVIDPETRAEIRRNPTGARALATYANLGIMLMPGHEGGMGEPVPPSPKVAQPGLKFHDPYPRYEGPPEASIPKPPQSVMTQEQWDALSPKVQALHKQGLDYLWGNANDRKYSGPLVGQQWADIYATPDTEFTVGEAPTQAEIDAEIAKGETPPPPKKAQDALDKLKDYFTENPPPEGPQPPTELPPDPDDWWKTGGRPPNPEGLKRGKVAVAKGFGPTHAENSKEGEDLTKQNTDTVPAMLTPREAVLNRNAAELAGRSTIEKLNAEGNKLAEKGVDLAAKGDGDVANLNGKQLWDAIMTALQGRQAPAEKLGPVPVPGAMAQKGTSDMKSKVKQSKPQSGSPYVQAFQKLMPGGGAPVGYQGGGNVMGTQIGFQPGTKDPNTYMPWQPPVQGGGNVPRNIRVGSQIGYPAGGTDPNTQSWVPNPAYNSNGGGGGMPGGMPGETPPQGTQNVNQWGKPYGWTPPPQPGGMPGGTPPQPVGGGGGVLGGVGGMPGMQGPGIPGQNVNQWGKPYGWNPGGSGSSYPPGKVTGLADGTSNAGPPGGGGGGFYPPGMGGPFGMAYGSPDVPQSGGIGSGNPQTEYGPPVTFTAPQLQAAAKAVGINPTQFAQLVKAFGGTGQGGMDTYGEGSQVSQALGPALENAFPGGGYQGGISDIGYPPVLMPNATYHADKGSTWEGPYDPKYLVQRYARGISSVPFR